jgi:hypothetical protein
MHARGGQRLMSDLVLAAYTAPHNYRLNKPQPREQCGRHGGAHYAKRERLSYPR